VVMNRGSAVPNSHQQHHSPHLPQKCWVDHIHPHQATLIATLRGRLEIGVSDGRASSVPSGHERTDALPQRPDRHPVAEHPPPVPRRRAAAPIPRPAPHLRPQGHRRCGLLHRPHRVPVAEPAARLPAVGAGLLLLLHVAGRRGLGPAPRRPPAGHPPAAGPGGDAQRRHHRQPERQDDRGRRPEGVRRGEKRCPAASGTCWSTRWG
jgi:hypothetical protein